MKHWVTLLFILTSIITYSQTTYYTTDGKNRLTEAEIKNKLSEIKAKMEKTLGKTVYTNLTILGTETKEDSIITKVSFNINTKKQDNLISNENESLAGFMDKAFPKFNLKTLEGETFNSEKLKGKPTMINFWFTKCAPCIDEMPVLNKIKEKYKDDFNFIAITYENTTNVEKLLKKQPFDFKQLVDAEDFINLLGIKAYPKNLFLDKEGVLKYVTSGIAYTKLDGEKLIMGDGKEIIEILEKLK